MCFLRGCILEGAMAFLVDVFVLEYCLYRQVCCLGFVLLEVFVLGCPVCGRSLDFDLKLKTKRCHSCGWSKKLESKVSA